MRDVIINFRLPNLSMIKKLITDPTLLKRRGMPKVSTLKVKPAICIIWEPKYVIVAYPTNCGNAWINIPIRIAFLTCAVLKPLLTFLQKVLPISTSFALIESIICLNILYSSRALSGE